MDVFQKLRDLQTHTNALKEGIGTRLERDPRMDIRSQQQVVIGSALDSKENLARFYSLGQHIKSIENSLEGFSGRYVIVPRKDVPVDLIGSVYPVLDCSKEEDKAVQYEKKAMREKYEGSESLNDADWIPTMGDYNKLCKDVEKVFRDTKEKLKEQRVLRAEDKTVKIPASDYGWVINKLYTGYNNSFFCNECHEKPEHLRTCADPTTCMHPEYHLQKGCPNKACYNNLYYTPPSKQMEDIKQ